MRLTIKYNILIKLKQGSLIRWLKRYKILKNQKQSNQNTDWLNLPGILYPLLFFTKINYFLRL